MTPAALQRVRLAVAKLLNLCPHNGGFYWETVCSHCGPDQFCNLCHTRAKRPRTDSDYPDYPASLDACAQFERGLTIEEREQYDVWLGIYCSKDYEQKLHWSARTTHATPLQRCLALLKLRLPPEEFAEIVKE